MEKEFLFTDEVHRLLLNANVVSAWDARQDAWKWFQTKHTGYELPWPKLRNSFLIAKGEMTIVSGYTGHGKSEFVNHIALHCVKQGAKAFIASLELSTGNLWGRLYRQSTGVLDPTYEYITKLYNFYDKKIFTYDLLGHADIDSLLESARVAHEYVGCDLFVFDNLMMLNSLVDDFKKQHEITQKLLQFAKDKNVSVILVAHSKKPSVNRDLPCPGMYDVSGSSNIVNMVDNHISVTINNTKIRAKAKLKENCELTDAEEKSLTFGDSIIVRDKKREVGELFRTSLYYDKRFTVLKEFETEKPFNYMDGKSE